MQNYLKDYRTELEKAGYIMPKTIRDYEKHLNKIVDPDSESTEEYHDFRQLIKIIKEEAWALLT